MGYEPYLVAPYENSGLKKWFKPWIIGRTSFPSINDAYPRRGVIRKREGMNLFATLPLEGGVSPPVQGLKNWVNPSTLGEYLLAFSRTKSYLFIDGSQIFSNVTFRPDGSPFSFSNGANDYFWTSNFAGSMWTANNLTADHINYWNLSNNWSVLQPSVDGVNTLDACLIILPYKGRLVALNTNEGAINYPNRARWCQLGTPYVLNDATHKPAPGFNTDANAWRSDIPGKGGFIDADTSQRIVSAAIVHDVLIVFFQRSTWRLTYTGNEILPFIWERLNTQYGSESPYSSIEFDEAALSFSRYGWIASSTNDVARIDLDIPDDSFAIEGTNVNIAGLNKVQGIRDFYRNFAYFTYIPIGQTICTQIYAYNYIDRSWTIFNPFNASQYVTATNGINVFGNYRNTAGDKTWSTFSNTGPTPQKDSWENYNSSNDKWSNFGAGQNENFPYILGGDLQGNVYTMFEFFAAPTSDEGVNFNFNITTKRDNPYISQGLRAKLAYVDIYCTTNPGGEITLQHFVDDQLSPIMTKAVKLFSAGQIFLSTISTGATTTLTTSSDHNLSVGQYVYLAGIIGSVGGVLNGNQYKVGTTPTNTTFTITDANGNNINTTGYVYTSGGYTYSADVTEGDSNYVRVFLGAVGRMHQINLTLSSAQLADSVKGTAQFELQGMVFWFRPMGRIKR
jgi:hypothetical protein